MGPLRFDRLLDAVTSAQVLWWIIWLGLVALTTSLLILMRTRWGQSQLLRKCTMLSLLVHMVLVTYATTVHIVASPPGMPEETQVSLLTEEGAGAESTGPEGESHGTGKPWEILPTRLPSQLVTVPLDRPES